MVEPFAQALGKASNPGHLALHQDVEVQRNPAFQLGQAEQRFHHQFGIDRAGLRLDYEADVLGGFVPDVADQRQLLLLEQLGDPCDQSGLLHQPGNLGDDDDPGAAGALFLHPFSAGAERAAAGDVGLGDRFVGIDDDAAGRKIRPLDPFQKRARFGLRLLDQVQCSVAKLGGIVRRDRGRHADGDALRAVGEQVREAAGQHHRLFAGVVIGRAQLNRVLVDAIQQQPGDVRQPGLGVAHRGRVIAVDIAKIALTVDQRIARGEILRETHHGVIDRLVAVRMVRAHYFADDLGRFLGKPARIKAQQPHAVEDAPMHRL